MTKQTTTFVMFGPGGVGPFSAELWRVGNTAQLVEDGGNGPFWLTAPADHNDDGLAPEHLVIGSGAPAVVARSLVLLMAATLGDEQLQARLQTSRSVTLEEGRRTSRGPGPSPTMTCSNAHRPPLPGGASASSA